MVAMERMNDSISLSSTYSGLKKERDLIRFNQQRTLLTRARARGWQHVARAWRKGSLQR